MKSLIHSKLQQLPNFNDSIVEIYELISNFIPYFIIYNYLSMLGLKLNHVRKRGPWYQGDHYETILVWHTKYRYRHISLVNSKGEINVICSKELDVLLYFVIFVSFIGGVYKFLFHCFQIERRTCCHPLPCTKDFNLYFQQVPTKCWTMLPTRAVINWTS